MWIPRLQLGLGWTQAVPDVTSSIWGSISVFPAPQWGFVSVSSSPGASVSLFIILTSLLLRGRASSLRHKGLLVVDVLFGFGKHLSHACLKALLYDQQVVARLPVCPGFDEVGHESDEEFLEGQD